MIKRLHNTNLLDYIKNGVKATNLLYPQSEKKEQ